jgi:actin related protein 2/3 complex subunit 2
MAREYGALITTTEPEYSITLLLKLEDFPAEAEARTAFIRNIALIRRHALSAPFERAFDVQRELEKTPLDPSDPITPQIMAIHYRSATGHSVASLTL